jgi:hypothetical protein
MEGDAEITKQDREELRNVVDEKTLAASKSGEGCAACVDQTETWRWVKEDSLIWLL